MPDDFETTPPSDGQSDRQPEIDPALRNVVPDFIDRFRIRRILGKGGFGVVYLAFDERLERQVAIKVPNSTLIQQSEDLQLYLKEARTVARLEHPNIVPVFEVGGNETCPIYIVSKYIEGMDLATRIRRSPPSNQQAAQWINDLSQALRLAHSQGIVHRDIKPQNILVDLQDRVFLVDFGLALRDEEVGKRLPAGGTPAYMSPEQAKGEGHRVDGRSDIFSLGVVFYEMLARHRPFHGDSSLELFEQIIELDPKPLRQWNDLIDRELERICQKMLSKRKSTRYSNAADLSEDLSLFVSKSQSEFITRSDSYRSDPGGFSTSQLAAPSSGNTRDTAPSSTPHTSGSKTLTIVPKGLRSFDYADADFFLELLPGPRDREGLPDGLSFWKSRIEERDPERTFPVGLIYGSSGCGKSSMMKAGLLPRLSKDVVSIYIEATPHDTERTLHKNLQKRLQLEGCFDVAESSNLTSLLASVRRGGQLPSRKKLLIVIDQFEQWLYVHTKAVGQELLDALEQCDGSRVQAIVMVRDDFWMAATRFFQDLDILLLERTNSAAVDLFDLDHAERVLKAFGRAYGKLAPSDLDEKQDRKQFITESVKGLSENNKVISVRLSLFAEMMKGRPWTTESLKEVGGTTGIGVTFLEETFSAPGAPPEHRYLQGAARSVLRSLLPDAGTDIKGHMRSREELFSVSGCQNRPRDFESLVRILDSELRLITPVDRYDGSLDGVSDEQGDPGSERIHFQLTHDYLVPSLREWLTRKQRETKRGRAELKLAERAASWSTNRENKQLPSVLEWLSIVSLTHRKGWSVPQRAMMKKAGQTYMLRGGIVCIVLIALVWGNLSLRNQMERKQAYLLAQKDLQQKEAEAEKLVEGLLTADPLQLPSRIAKLKDYHEWAKDDLTKASTEAAEGSNEKLYAGLALIANEMDVDSRLVEQMGKRLLDATPQQFLPIRDILAPHKGLLIANYWSIALDSTVNPEHRLHSACALADFDGSNLNWENQELSRFLSDRLVAVNPIHLSVWEEALKPISPRLLEPLSRIFNNPTRTELARSIATSLLADYAKDNPQFLSRVLIDADTSAFATLFSVLQSHGREAIRELESVIDQKLEPDWNDIPINAAWNKPSTLDSIAVEDAHGAIAARYAFCQDMPWVDFKRTAESLRASGYRPTKVRTFPIAADASNEAKSLESQLRVAAVWTRDGKRWLLETDVKKSDLPNVGESPSKDGLTITDISVSTAEHDATDPRCVVLWSEPDSALEQRRIVVGVNTAELSETVAALATQGFECQETIHVFATPSGDRLYSGVWSNLAMSTELETAHQGRERIHKPLWDVAIAPTSLELDTSGPSDRQGPFAALWRTDLSLESQFISTYGDGTAKSASSDHLLPIESIKASLTQGYRPFAISVGCGSSSKNSERTGSMVLHRPLVVDALKENLALQQANAAVALLKLNAPEQVWTKFQHQSDPRLRGYLIHHLTKLNVDPAAIVGRLNVEVDTSSRRALILAIGEFAKAKLLGNELETIVKSDLARLYDGDPDSGIHAACEWTLRQMGAMDVVLNIKHSKANGEPSGARGWYVTRTGGHTMMILQPAKEFLMGSPISERDRYGGPENDGEALHRVVMDRTIAIAAHEVTISQFQAFRPAHEFNRVYSKEADAPANLVSWYDSAAYCNWLSQQEEIPQDQWCYDPDPMG